MEWPSVPVLLLLLLAIIEVSLSIFYQVLVCNVAMANTIFCLLSIVSKENDSKTLFVRICSCIAFCGILFVNTTHALEMLTETLDDDTELEHHHGHDESGHFPVAYLYTSVADIVIKASLIYSRCLPSFSLPKMLQYLLHCLPSVVVLSLYFLSLSVHLLSWWFEHLNPVSTVILTVFSGCIIVSMFKYLKPFIFLDSPVSFDDSFLKKDIYTRFPSIRCTHIHVFRVWPKSSSEAVVHLNIQTDKSSSSWETDSQITFSKVSLFIRDHLHSYSGTRKVTIEPHFVDSHGQWQSCTTEKCERGERTCCIKRRETGKV